MQLKNPKETLLNVANYLEGGLPNDAPRIGHIGFNLAIGGEVRSCGAVACIGGIAWVWENPSATMNDAKSFVDGIPEGDPLERLFYPRIDEGFPHDNSYYEVTPKEASDAIRRYFYGEQMFWDHVKSREV